MKRFLVFSGAHYYPGGGWNDFRGAFETSDEARAFLKESAASDFAKHGTRDDWAQVVDLETGKEIP